MEDQGTDTVHNTPVAPEVDSSVIKLKGLPWSTTEQQIYEFFHGFNLHQVAFVREPDGRPSGMAFAEFSNKEEAVRALSLQGHYIGERYVRLLHVPKAEMDEQVRFGTLAVPGYAARIRSRLNMKSGRGGPGVQLPQQQTGAVAYPQAVVPPMAVGGRRAGFRPPPAPVPPQQYLMTPMGMQYYPAWPQQGYIPTFIAPAPAAGAPGLADQFAAMNIGAVPPMPVPPPPRPSGPGGRGAGAASARPLARPAPLPGGRGQPPGPPSYTPGHQPGAVLHSVSHPPVPPAASGPPPPSRAGLTVKIRGLPYRTTEDEIYAFFQGFGFVPGSLQLGSDNLGRPSGEGWIKFSSTVEAARAVTELHGQYIGSRYLELTVC